MFKAINAIRFGIRVYKEEIITHNDIQYYHTPENNVWCNHDSMGMVAGKQHRTAIGGIMFTAMCYFVLTA